MVTQYPPVELPEETADDRAITLTYLDLRKAIGIIGITLPFVLVLGKMLIDGGGLQSSLSAYYYTSTRNYFIGAMCAMGVFLISYRYGSKSDWANRLTNLASLAAIGVGLFPTAPKHATDAQLRLSQVHAISAATFFIVLGFVSFFLFTSNQTKQERFRHEDWVYRGCGLTMWGSIIALGVSNASFASAASDHRLLLILETLMVLAFGTSWLVKGQFLDSKTRAAVAHKVTLMYRGAPGALGMRGHLRGHLRTPRHSH